MRQDGIDPFAGRLQVDLHAPAGAPVAAPSDALQRALEAAQASRSVADAFRDAVCAYVRELKEAGVTPEKALVTVKHHLGRKMSPLVLDQAAAWCVGVYFGELSSAS